MPRQSEAAGSCCRPAETARSSQQQIDALQTAMTEAVAKQEAASLQARLTAKIDLLMAEMNRIAEGDDNFGPADRTGRKLSAKRLEQVTRQKMQNWLQPDRSAATAGWDAAARRATLEESLAALAQRSIGQGLQPSGRQGPQPDRDRPKKGHPRSCRKRLERQQAETAALSRARAPPTAARKWGARWPALRTQGRCRTEYDQTVAKLG
ncbi:MAG: hypothetical protein ACLTNY_00155 [Blautia massiliensis (ex Durand et al. 2017)]